MASTTAQLDHTRRRRVRGFAAAVLASILFLTFAPVVAGGAGASPAAPHQTVVAPGGRVDLYTPTFSHPTEITNPLFPISKLRQVIQLGHEGDAMLRHEITLLPETRFIPWNGQRVEVLVSQFVAYSDGRILETAVDYFAQDDRGAAWYFGEDVSNFVDGVLDNHDGTWRAGRDGPPGMIMPAHPRVGDVYHPENIPGLVFEEVIVKKVDQTVSGPTGPVTGAIVVQEHPADGAVEDKVFAPGYGEFQASVPVDDEFVEVAVAHPIDLVGKASPKRLWTMAEGARKIFYAARGEQWNNLAAAAANLRSAWNKHQAGDVPPLLEAQTNAALDALDDAVSARSVADVKQASIEVALSAFDLQMQYRDPAKIDGNRINAWNRQRELDLSTGDAAGVKSDRVILEAIDDRRADD